MKRASLIPARRRARAVALIAVGLVVAVGLAACGDTVGYSEGTGDRIRGKELFVKGCGSCHTLADAGTTGKIGPNLDYAFVQSRIDGLGDSTILQVVRGQIAYPVTEPSTGAPGMPADIVTGQDAEDVATYVAAVAGLDANGEPIDPANPPKPAPPEGGGDATASRSSPRRAAAAATRSPTPARRGTVGPNLDEAKPSLDLAIDRVTNGKGGMPSFKGQLSEAQIEDVATFVADDAGK